MHATTSRRSPTTISFGHSDKERVELHTPGVFFLCAMADRLALSRGIVSGTSYNLMC